MELMYQSYGNDDGSDTDSDVELRLYNVHVTEDVDLPQPTIQTQPQPTIQTQPSIHSNSAHQPSQQSSTSQHQPSIQSTSQHQPSIQPSLQSTRQHQPSLQPSLQPTRQHRPSNKSNSQYQPSHQPSLQSTGYLEQKKEATVHSSRTVYPAVHLAHLKMPAREQIQYNILPDIHHKPAMQATQQPQPNLQPRIIPTTYSQQISKLNGTNITDFNPKLDEIFPHEREDEKIVETTLNKSLSNDSSNTSLHISPTHPQNKPLSSAIDKQNTNDSLEGLSHNAITTNDGEKNSKENTRQSLDEDRKLDLLNTRSISLHMEDTRSEQTDRLRCELVEKDVISADRDIRKECFSLHAPVRQGNNRWKHRTNILESMFPAPLVGDFNAARKLTDTGQFQKSEILRKRGCMRCGHGSTIKSSCTEGDKFLPAVQHEVCSHLKRHMKNEELGRDRVIRWLIK